MAGPWDSGQDCWAPRPVTTLGVYKALGTIVGFWQKAMELKSLMMVFFFFFFKSSLRIPSVPASALSEMQTPGHPWLCPQPAMARGGYQTLGATWGSSPTLSEGLHPPPRMNLAQPSTSDSEAPMPPTTGGSSLSRGLRVTAQAFSMRPQQAG